MNPTYPPAETFLSEAQELVEIAKQRGLLLRIMGALAIRLHSKEYVELHKKLKRLGEREFTDIDFMTLGKQRREVRKLLEEKGYKIDPMVLGLFGYKRHIYHNPKNNINVDVFFDKLEMCHTIDFKNRLEVDYPTISLADLLLEKMQIVHINEKDIKDTIVLLRAHNVSDNDKETVNAKYIAKLLSKDWGFWYTVTTNLKKLEKFLNKYDALTNEDRKDVSAKIYTLMEYIDKEPKSIGWRLRARTGPRKKWYRDVEEVSR